jgi:putative tryptophan/tyrosine transport system substrate-binding protein
MKRREFIAGLGSAVAWPLVARAQQPAAPVVGFLFSSTSKAVGPFIAGLAADLAEIGYAEGRNVAFEYRMAEDHFERLPALANDLVRRRVAVIFTVTLPATLAAKAATQAVQLYSSLVPTQLKAISSPVSRDAAATSPASPFLLAA